MTPFNWDHPSLTLSHHVRRDDVVLSVPEWVLPKEREPFWTHDRLAIAAYFYSLLFALLVGYAWGANG